MFELTTITLFGLLIHEPVTTFTDLIVSAVCFYSFRRLSLIENPNKIIVNFKIYFLIMSIATALGGILGHAFIYAIPFAWKLPGWVSSMIAIMFIERAAIEHIGILLKPSMISILKVLNVVEFLIFLSLTLYFLDFFFVEFHSGYGIMFVVLSLQLIIYLKTKNTASKTILIAVAFAAAAAMFFITKVQLFKWFNYNDVSHVLMSISAFIFLQGALRINELAKKAENLISADSIKPG